MMQTIVRPARDLRNHYAELSELLKDHDHIIITNRGRGESVLINIEDYAQYEAFLHQRYVAEALAEAKRQAAGPGRGQAPGRRPRHPLGGPRDRLGDAPQSLWPIRYAICPLPSGTCTRWPITCPAFTPGRPAASCASWRRRSPAWGSCPICARPTRRTRPTAGWWQTNIWCSIGWRKRKKEAPFADMEPVARLPQDQRRVPQLLCLPPGCVHRQGCQRRDPDGRLRPAPPAGPPLGL